MAKLLMLFNRPRLELLAEVRRGAAPDELAYGAIDLERRGWELLVTDQGFKPGFQSKAWTRLFEDRFSHKGRRVGFNLPQAWRLRDLLRRADAIFATGDAAALAALAVRRGLDIDTPLLAGSIGLAAGLAEHPSRFVAGLSRGLLGRAEQVVCYSAAERENLIKLGLAPERVSFVPFGVDCQRHQPADPSADGPALAFGNDRRRDWRTLFAALGRAPRPLTLVTYPEFLNGIKLPAGVEHLAGPLPFGRLDALVEAARYVVLPVAENDYTAAQISLLYCLARGKAVVASATAALRQGYDVEHGRQALLVPPGDDAALAAAMLELDLNPGLRAALGAAGRALVLERLSIRRYGERIDALLRGML